jgi:Flp pilus assembly protein protease CpaA
MEIFILGSLLSIFCFLNLGIIWSDFRKKIIPNKFLLGLIIILPVWYIFGYYSWYIWEFSVSWFILKVMLSLTACFLLYYFSLWWAGDSKYIFILSLYIPESSIIILFWNTALLTLLIMILYFFYFFSIKLSFNKGFRKEIFQIIKNDYTLSRESFTRASESFISLLNLILWLLLIYLWVRFIRNILVDYLYISEIQSIWILYTEYIIFYVIIIFIILIYILRYVTTKLFNILEEKWYKVLLIKSLCLYASIFLLIIIIFFQYQSNAQETKNTLILLATLYLFIYLSVLGWKYLFSLTFSSSEKINTLLNELHPGMILDKNHIQHIFKWREVLADDMGYDMNTKILDKQNIQSIKKTIKYINLNITRNKKNEDIISSIIIIKTFSYGVFIYIGFIITFILWDNIIQFLMNLIQELFIK